MQNCRGARHFNLVTAYSNRDVNKYGQSSRTVLVQRVRAAQFNIFQILKIRCCIFLISFQSCTGEIAATSLAALKATSVGFCLVVYDDVTFAMDTLFFLTIFGERKIFLYKIEHDNKRLLFRPNGFSLLLFWRVYHRRCLICFRVYGRYTNHQFAFIIPYQLGSG